MNQRSRRATLIGFTAILLWATLALLTKLSGTVPPFQLTAMAFTVSSCVSLVFWWKQGINGLDYLKLPKAVWLLGLFGLFGYHCFYFIALRYAPVVEASLIAYLWPLLIVLLSTLLPHETLRWFHIVGALMGFGGAVLLVTGGQSIQFNTAYTLGYLAALACAFTWSSYSVLSRHFGAIPTDAVGAFCIVTAILAWICHGLFESIVIPTGWEWIAILCLGLGPVGLAFFTWDYGVKQGDIKVLGALSYAAPLLSTLLLIVCGLSPATWNVWMACGLIIGGAVIATGSLSGNR